MIDTTARDAKARNLCARISSDRRTETELDVLDLLLSGIESHEAEYGGAHADSDTRDCLDERDQEMQDGLFYHLLEAVKRRAARRRRVTAFKDAFDDEPTREFSRAGTSEQPPSTASLSAAPSAESLTPGDIPPIGGGAALSLEVNGKTVVVAEIPPLSDVSVSPDFDCDECGQVRGTHHLHGCGWTRVVPAPESEVA